MELRSGVDISSSWEPSAHFQSVLYLSNRAGNIVEGPEQSTCLRLSQQEGEGSGCYLHLRQLGQLSGYMVCGVELQSGSRTVELYNGDDYISTSRGTLLEDTTGDDQVYQCSVQLPADEGPYHNLSLKLLSLQGRTNVLVKKLSLVVVEDYGGKATASKMDRVLAGKSPDLQSLINSLPLHSSNAPPFLHGLLSSLQHLTTSTQHPSPLTQHPSQPHSQPEQDKQQPLELAQMISAFRQLRPAPSVSETSETSAANQDREDTGEGKEGPAQHKDVSKGDRDLTSLEAVEGLVEQKIAALEERLKDYIDKKLAAFFSEIELRLEQRDSVKSEISEGDKMDEHRATNNGLHYEEQLD